MKTNLLFFFIISLVIHNFNAIGQTIPYRFKNLKSLAGTRAADKTGDNKTIFEIKFWKSADRKEYYEDRAIDPTFNRFVTLYENQYYALEKSIIEDYTKKRIEKEQNLSTAKTVEELKRLKNELDAIIKAEDEELGKLRELKQIAKEYRFRSRTTRKINFLHVGTAPHAQAHYNSSLTEKNSKFLNNTVLLYTPQGGTASIFSEIFADYFGPVRAGFGALLTSGGNTNEEVTTPNTPADNKEETQNDAVQRLLGGGGNAVVNLSYPFLDLNNTAENVFLKLAFVPKFAADIPSIGTAKGDASIHRNIGIEGSLFYNGFLDVLTLYTNFRFAKIDGNRYFHQYLNKEDRSAFWFNQLSAGIAINSTFRISGNYYFGSKFSNEILPFSLGFTIVPNN